MRHFILVPILVLLITLPSLAVPVPPEAEALLKKEITIPFAQTIRWSRDRVHDANATHIQLLLNVYANTSDRRFAEKARDWFLAYAGVHPRFVREFYDGRIRGALFEQLLDESVWLVNMAESFQQLDRTGILTPADRTRIVDDLLRPSARLSAGSFMALSNHKWWANAALGVTGYVIGDNAFVDEAINSEYGFRRHIAEAMNDDGLLWEQSPAYHYYAMEPYIHLAEAAATHGADLYNLSVPDRSEWDGDHGPKSFKMMFDSLFFLAFPNGDIPSVKDSSHGPLVPLRNFCDLRAKRFPDTYYLRLCREYAALIAAGPRAASLLAPDLDNSRFAANGRSEWGSSLFPSSGYAVLRSDPDNPMTSSVLFTFGPYGGGHGHPDRLGIVFHAGGELLAPDTGAYRYSDPRHESWAKQTVAHNTLVVNERSQKPMDIEGMNIWADAPRDSTPCFVDFFSRPGWKIARAALDCEIPKPTIERTLILVDGDLIDIFDVRDTTRPKKLDWAFHVAGEPAAGPVAFVTPVKLPKHYGYQHLLNPLSATPSGPVVLSWTTPGGNTLRSFLFTEPGDTLIRASAPGAPPETLWSALLWRRTADSKAWGASTLYPAETRFLALHSPSAASPDPPLNVEYADVSFFSVVEPFPLSLRITRGLGVETLVWNPLGTRLNDPAGIESDAQGYRALRIGSPASELRLIFARFNYASAAGTDVLRSDKPLPYAEVTVSSLNKSCTWDIESVPGATVSLNCPAAPSASNWTLKPDIPVTGNRVTLPPSGSLHVELR